MAQQLFLENWIKYINFFVYNRFLTTELIDYEAKFKRIEEIRNNYYRMDKEDKSEKYLDSVLGKRNYDFREFNSFYHSREVLEKEKTLNSVIFKDSIDYWNQIGINKTLEKEQKAIDNLKKLLSKNQFNYEEIENFLLEIKFEKKIEDEIITKMIQKNSETFLKVLENQKNDFKSSKLRDQFFSFDEMNQKEYYKPICLSISECKYESKFKKAILKSISKGKRQHIKFMSAALISPALVIIFILALTL